MSVIGNPKICKHKKNNFFFKKWPNTKHGKKTNKQKNKIKITKIKIKCVGGGGGGGIFPICSV